MNTVNNHCEIPGYFDITLNSGEVFAAGFVPLLLEWQQIRLIVSNPVRPEKVESVSMISVHSQG